MISSDQIEPDVFHHFYNHEKYSDLWDSRIILAFRLKLNLFRWYPGQLIELQSKLWDDCLLIKLKWWSYIELIEKLMPLDENREILIEFWEYVVQLIGGKIAGELKLKEFDLLKDCICLIFLLLNLLPFLVKRLLAGYLDWKLLLLVKLLNMVVNASNYWEGFLQVVRLMS